MALRTGYWRCVSAAPVLSVSFPANPFDDVDTCRTCGHDGNLIVCEECEHAYHLMCAGFRLRKRWRASVRFARRDLPRGRSPIPGEPPHVWDPQEWYIGVPDRFICDVCAERERAAGGGLEAKTPAKEAAAESPRLGACPVLACYPRLPSGQAGGRAVASHVRAAAKEVEQEGLGSGLNRPARGRAPASARHLEAVSRPSSSGPDPSGASSTAPCSPHGTADSASVAGVSAAPSTAVVVVDAARALSEGASLPAAAVGSINTSGRRRAGARGARTGPKKRRR